MEPTFRDFAVETYGRMSDAARQTVRDMGRMYEELYGGCGGVAPMTRAQFIDFVRRVISVINYVLTAYVE